MLTIYEIFERVGKTKNRVDASKVLFANQSDELKYILKYMFDPTSPKFTKLKIPKYEYLDVTFGEVHSYLKFHMNRLVFLYDTCDLKIDKKLMMLMGILGSLHKQDAIIVEKMILGKKIKFHRITESAVRLAFPGLLPEKK